MNPSWAPIRSPSASRRRASRWSSIWRPPPSPGTASFWPQAEGERIPDGVAYDAEGRLTTDPTTALAGAIMAFGGYKGAALALIVEILTRPLVDAIAQGRRH